MLAILYNIRSIHNVGSIFRTADAVGIERLYICGITPDPIDRLGKPRADMIKTSLGAEKAVCWKHVGKSISPQATIALIKKLKKDGFIVAALEQSAISKNLFHYRFPKKKFALIIGNEIYGIPSSILRYCDVILEIPMHGKKESLNVSVAFGIAVYHLQRQ